MPCLIISFNYDMSAANEAKWPVPNGGFAAILRLYSCLYLIVKKKNAHKTILV